MSAKNEETKSTRRDSKARLAKRPGVTAESSPPEAAGEESAVPDVVPEQPQGHGRVLDVAVGEQQQVPHAARRRQQAEVLQGAPQLRAAPSWTQTLAGGRRRNGQASRPTLIYSSFCQAMKRIFIPRFTETMNAALNEQSFSYPDGVCGFLVNVAEWLRCPERFAVI